MRTKHICRGPWAKSIEVCRNAATKFNELRERLARKIIVEVGGAMPASLVRQAFNEAEALAWTTPYPMLFLPALAEEKAQNIRNWADRQRDILKRQAVLKGRQLGTFES